MNVFQRCIWRRIDEVCQVIVVVYTLLLLFQQRIHCGVPVEHTSSRSSLCRRSLLLITLLFQEYRLLLPLRLTRSTHRHFLFTRNSYFRYHRLHALRLLLQQKGRLGPRGDHEYQRKEKGTRDRISLDFVLHPPTEIDDVLDSLLRHYDMINVTENYEARGACSCNTVASTHSRTGGQHSHRWQKSPPF